jgi:hypothetical protein
MKELLTSNWTFLRALRLLLGGAFLLSAYMQQDIIPAFIGGLFIYQSVMNTGCAGGSCAAAVKGTTKTVEDVEFEEIK